MRQAMALHEGQHLIYGYPLARVEGFQAATTLHSADAASRTPIRQG